MTNITLNIPDTDLAATIICVIEEMKCAKIKHPNWPTDNVKRAAIVGEEAGEVIREANQLDEGKGSLQALRNELIQCAGTCLRMLDALNEDEAELKVMYGEYMGEH